MLLIPFAGLPAVTRERLADFPGLAVHNLHHNAAATAELATGLLLACARGIVPVHNQFRDGDWTTRYTSDPPHVILNGKTALIVGYGAVGRRVGAVCTALGMQVIGVRRRTTDSEPGVVSVRALGDWLPRADVLVIAVPGTAETEGLIGAAELAQLPRTAIVINTGRAAVINEAALYMALRDGHLHAAGLDVWYQYPPDEDSRTDTYPAEHPFWELDNVVMSPHRGGAYGTADIERERMAGVARALNAAAAGDPVPHPVDLDAGY